MYQVWDGDLFLFTVDYAEEAEVYREEGYTVKEQDLS